MQVGHTHGTFFSLSLKYLKKKTAVGTWQKILFLVSLRAYRSQISLPLPSVVCETLMALQVLSAALPTAAI